MEEQAFQAPASPQVTSIPQQPNPPDAKLVVVILLLVFFYPLGIIFMWAWMKTWQGWLKLVVSIPLILAIFSIALAVALLRSSGSSTYHPSQENVSEDIQHQSTGNKMYDQADDTARRSDMQLLDHALKNYYTAYNRAPESLSVLIPQYLASDNSFLDIRTKEPFTYKIDDSGHGCIASDTLTTGEVIYAYCR